LLEKDVPFQHTTTQKDTFGAIANSIRTTLIVSDKHGYELVYDLVSGISFNHSISSIIILNEGDMEDKQKLWVKNFNGTKAAKKVTSAIQENIKKQMELKIGMSKQHTTDTKVETKINLGITIVDSIEGVHE